MSGKIEFYLDGTKVAAEPGETIWQAAQRLGKAIPHLCHRQQSGYRADGNCRACVVEIEGERALAASCVRLPDPGMKVATDTGRVHKSRSMVLELLLADLPNNGADLDADCHLARTIAEWGPAASRFPAGGAQGADHSHPAMTFSPDVCIHCGLCVRACREVQHNDVIGMARRGRLSQIVFDIADAMGDSTCVACGECVQACPSGALAPAGRRPAADKTVNTLCPYCGVGCQTAMSIKDNKVIGTEGRNGPANLGRLCVKGRFGMDYIHHPHRLTKPLIRKEGAKDPDLEIDPADPLAHFRQATWEEALDRAADGFKRILDEHGPDALGGLGTAKGSNEEGYLFQKLIRTGFRTNNVDHCARLCHSSSVAALFECIGSGAVTLPFNDCLKSDVIMVIGANPPVNHPVAATFIKDAARSGKTLIVCDPSQNPLFRHATYPIQHRPGSDVALLNAMMHTIVAEGLHDQAFIEARTEGFAGFKAHLEGYAPEAMAEKCGIEADLIRTIARTYAAAERAIVLWGMGITQHVHGTNNARCLAALALMCGQVGRPGAGLHPLRGQNNVQGASDVGILPTFLPGYRRVDDDQARNGFEELWQTPLPSRPGLTVVEMIHGALDGALRGMLIMGENPAMSDPDITTVRKGLAALDHLVVQEIFLTETAAFADVILPASAQPEKAGTYTNTNRQVQMGRPALEPPGEARQDWAILQELGRRLGLQWDYSGAGDIWEELRRSWPALAGISWRRLESEDAVTHPCAGEDQPGQAVILGEKFNTANGLGKFVAVDIVSPAEMPDAEFPMVLTTGRLLEHWHTGAMSRRADVLDRIEPEAIAHLAPADLGRLDVAPGQPVVLCTRRGTIRLAARADASLPEGMVFVPFCFSEAPGNALTKAALDPISKIPEYKFCAVRVERA